MMQQTHEEPTTSGAVGDAPSSPSPEALALLHEVDHRVKNNMQLIASLILLQSRRSADPTARDALRSVLARVNAVATVHRRLFQGDVQRFEVDEFVRDLASDLATGRDGVEIALALEPVQIPASAAAPFALIANELLGNAIKHGYPEGRRGRISVQLAQEGDACVLRITDDGVGLTDEAPGFGLSLVRLMCQQLHAELELNGGAGGTRAALRTPLRRAGG